MANVMLVHGAWSDGSIWQEVTAGLQADGHRVMAVQLPLTSLADDIAWTRRHIAILEAPVTLVGHSYGGTVISGAARDGEVTSLVFVAGYAPDKAETIPMLSDRGSRMPLRDAMRFSADGWSTLDPELFGHALGADLPEATTQVLAATQKPTHGNCLTSPSERGAWHDLPCAYVMSLDDHALDPDLQRWFAERAKATVTELHSSHLSPLSHPIEVTAAIRKALPA